MPRVSVLTPIYNTNPAHLREMIESILNQTFTDFEFLILSDSPDNTELDRIVKSYRDRRIKYIKNDRNMGISASRNRLLGMARGEYVAIFDHDDISVPTRLAQSVEFLDANPDVGVVSGWLEYFGAANHIRKTPEHDVDIRIYLTQDCYVAHTAAMIRRSVLVDNGIEYEEFFTPAEDYQLWSRLMDVTRFHNLQTVLVRYRWGGDNTTTRMDAMMERAARNIRMDIGGRYPEYLRAARNMAIAGTRFRLRLFGVVPFLKIKNGWVKLFEFIPLFKMVSK